MQKLLPWTPKAERTAAIAHARAGKEQALRDLARAQAVASEIEGQARANHYAAWIADQIIQGHLGNANGGT